MSILTVTLNAAVDKTYTVPGFALNGVYRPTQMRVTAGGKGINVARVYQTLGGQAVATGFLGGSNGHYIRRQLMAERIRDSFVTVAEESRVCIAVMDPVAGTQTEVNENGPNVQPADCEALFGRLRELLPGCEAVILSGSIPPGTPPTVYRDIIRLAQEEFGVRAVLDTSGEALVQGMTARPYLAKPNQHELSALGIPADDIGMAAQELHDRFGVPVGLVSAGARGAYLAAAEGAWSAVPPPVNLVSAVGSGDSMTAGFLWATLRQNATLPEALRLGVGAGAANVLSEGAGFLESAQVFHLASRTRLTRLA
ncbi:MAG: 1-phosphofructokinase family hexose kinase [Armatimonadota bacterium]|nr:1-phosphofructokinase family hexose kinase [Armatimonadota bacterium]